MDHMIYQWVSGLSSFGGHVNIRKILIFIGFRIYPAPGVTQYLLNVLKVRILMDFQFIQHRLSRKSLQKYRFV